MASMADKLGTQLRAECGITKAGEVLDNFLKVDLYHSLVAASRGKPHKACGESFMNCAVL
eukprot:UN4433